MTHSSEEAWALDDDRRDRVGDHTARGFCTDLAGLHSLHASGAISDYGPTGQCLPPRIYYGSYSATEILLYSALPPHGARPGSAPDLDQLLTGKVGLTPLFGPQLQDSGSEFGIPVSEAEKVVVDWTRELVDALARRVFAGDSPVECARSS